MPNFLTYYRRTRSPGYISGIAPEPTIIIDLPDKTNLTVWLKPESLAAYADTDPIDTWVDSSGLIHNATGITTARPLYKSAILNGFGVARFDGVNDLLSLGNLSDHFSTAASLFVVVYINSDTQYSVYSNANVDSYWRWATTGNGYIGTFRTARISAYPATMPTTGWHIMTLISRAADYIFYLDTIAKTTQVAGFSAGATHQIGNEVGKTYWLTGDVAEVILYADDKTANRAAIETYLKDKYGI